MKRFCALGCCLLFLASGPLVGSAHLHGSSDAGEGLHFDHAHLLHGDPHPHTHAHPRDARHGHSPDATAPEAAPADHDHGAIVYLDATILRQLDPTWRVLSATVSDRMTFDPPTTVSHRAGTRSTQPRDPPRADASRPRAPPF